MKKYIMLTLVVVLLFLGCKNTDDSNTPKTEPTNISILVEPVTHEYFTGIKPKAWKEMALPQISLYKYFPEGVNSTDKYPENIMIIISNATDSELSKSIEQIVNEGITKSKESNPDMKVLAGPKPAKLGPLDGIEIRTQTTIDGEKRDSIQIFAKKDKKFYVMTYSCESGNCKNYYVLDIMAKNIQPK